MSVGSDLRAAESNVGIESFLNEVMTLVRQRAPHLESLLSVFSQEAKYGREWLTPKLASIKPGAHILEVGAGLMLLSCQLTKEGFKVTALEPFGDGFSHFSELQRIILAYAAQQGITPSVMTARVEQLSIKREFDFAFSINVMEHIEDVPAAIRAVMHSLKLGTSYCFVCANYLFPYEPHFDIPTLFSKKLTWTLFRKKILRNKRVVDPMGVWVSLNWISVPIVARAARSIPNVSIQFGRSMLKKSLMRVITDPEFAARRSPLIQGIVKIIIGLGLHHLANAIPPTVQPVIDCTISRQE